MTLEELRQRAAWTLRWSVPETQTMSLAALRDAVRGCRPSKHRDEILRELDAVIRDGKHVVEAMPVPATDADVAAFRAHFSRTR